MTDRIDELTDMGSDDMLAEGKGSNPELFKLREKIVAALDATPEVPEGADSDSFMLGHFAATLAVIKAMGEER